MHHSEDHSATEPQNFFWLLQRELKTYSDVTSHLTDKLGKYSELQLYCEFCEFS